jgi:hypothetical protein
VPATCLIGWSVRDSDKEEIDSRTTVANTVAKPLDDACQAWTSLEHRPRAPTRLDGLGRLARNYGSDGRHSVTSEGSSSRYGGPSIPAFTNATIWLRPGR